MISCLEKLTTFIPFVRELSIWPGSGWDPMSFLNKVMKAVPYEIAWLGTQSECILGFLTTKYSISPLRSWARTLHSLCTAVYNWQARQHSIGKTRHCKSYTICYVMGKQLGGYKLYRGVKSSATPYNGLCWPAPFRDPVESRCACSGMVLPTHTHCMCLHIYPPTHPHMHSTASSRQNGCHISGSCKDSTVWRWAETASPNRNPRSHL